MIMRTREKTRYSFIDAGCLGRKCFAPGFYQHRAPLMGGGSRNTGSPDTPCCLNRAYSGCPSGPVGERKERCFRCDGIAEGDVCCVCGGTGEITISGLPVVDMALTRERKAKGWRWKS